MNKWRVVGRVSLRTVIGSVPFWLASVMLSRSTGVGSKLVMAYLLCFLILLVTLCYAYFVIKNASSTESDKEERLVDNISLILYLFMFGIYYHFILAPEMT